MEIAVETWLLNLTLPVIITRNIATLYAKNILRILIATDENTIA